MTPQLKNDSLSRSTFVKIGLDTIKVIERVRKPKTTLCELRIK